MPDVQFVVPYSLPISLRFLRGVAALPAVRLGVIGGEPLERLPDDVRRRLAGHWRVRDPLDPRQLLEASRGLSRQMAGAPPDRLLGVLEQLQEPLAVVREELGIPGMGRETARNFRDKAWMKTLLRRAGLPCARHCLAESAEGARAFAAATGFPLVVKPPAGAGAQATFRVDDPEQLEAALAAHRPSPGQPWLFEEFVLGDEHSFDTLSIDGRAVWHSLTHYLPTPLEVLRNPWIQWCVLLPREVDAPLYDDIRTAAFRTLEVLGMGTGMSHLEWFRRRDGSIAISEVAARPPGAQITTLMALAHELDIYRAWARLMVHGELDLPQRRYAAGAAFLRGQGQGRVKAVHGLEEAQRGVAGLVVDVQLPRPGQPRSASYEGEGYVVLRHPDTAVVRRALHHLVSTIRVEVE
ncbi:MAG TPA: ATP-grasp domain-containing protein [Thermoanaerobaculia bacterium]|nr:ATP-grasp domain-containing protein [Thermoanaerobaculia bacterium]